MASLRGPKPQLIIVGGPPGAGKTTLATALSAAMGLPVIAKDSIKEVLMDHLGGAEPVGTAAFAVQFAVARTLLESGSGLILEGAFFHDQHGLREVATLANAAVISVSAPLECLVDRYVTRQVDRHPGHRGLEALPDLRARVLGGRYEPPDLGAPLLRVDSARGFEPSESDIHSWLVTALATVSSSTSG